ncbi:omega-6 fatty acid desaturase, chloroplastic [Selaginella moellendorffii]|nr:omega-6 fatty acid desaturase, chloroplastic [Selaginella moellendorffii]|eukprot:XP_002985345.2 omega-6 fatty acid desaturase, chloroplastic [Selaginella moellendorffii]
MAAASSSSIALASIRISAIPARGLVPFPRRKATLRLCLDVITAGAIARDQAAERKVVMTPGFTQMGEPVPAGMVLNDVVKTLPKEVFEVDDFKAWKTVAITVSALVTGYAALAVAPWYLYPFIYAFLGTAATGLFVIGHDCGHNSFSKSQLVNDIVGNAVMTPLVFPFEPWRIKHNTHHAHTNKLIMDTAWQPFRPHQFDNADRIGQAMMRATMGPLWWMASIGHWLFWHFDLNKFRPQEHAKVKTSIAACYAFGFLVLLPLLVTQGPVGFVKWWLLPWLGFHFWMSTFTLVHHTAPHIPFKQNREWNAVGAQLAGTVHCEYPAWIDFLCHDISVHIPHHLSTKIPSYNLRAGHASLLQNWDCHLNKAVFGVPLMTTILTQCNLFDAEKKQWVGFDNRA